jgi:hypothetical protein
VSGLEGPAFSSASRLAIAAGRRYLRSTEFERLCEELERALSTHVPFTSADYAAWSDDEGFAAAIGKYIEPPHIFDRERLVGAIVPLVGRLNDELDEAALAGMVADAIHDRMRFAKSGDALTRFEHDQLSEVIRVGLSAAQQHRDVAWAPIRAHSSLERLETNDPAGSFSLRTALAGRDLHVELRRLVESPPGWLQDASWQVWGSVARLCEVIGLWSEAQLAYEASADRPGADRARDLMAASGAAGFRGDLDAAARLRANARGIDPENAMVQLVEIAEVRDRTERLARLRQRATTSDRELEAIAANLEAISLLDLDETEQAGEAAGRAMALAPTSLLAREASAAVSLAQNWKRRRDGTATNRNELLEAGDEYRRLRDDLRSSRRFAESGGMLSKVAECQNLAGRSDLARVTVQEALDAELAAGDVALMLADVAYISGAADLAQNLVGEYGGESERAEHLRAILALSDPTRRDEGIAVLDRRVLAGDFESAVARLSAAIPADGGVEWSDDAENVVRSRDSAVASFAKADWHDQRGHRDEASRELARHSDDPRALRELMTLFAADGLWSRAAAASRALLARRPDPDTAVDAGTVLMRAGDGALAESVLRGVLANQNAHLTEVGRAFRVLATELMARGRSGEARDLALDAASRGYADALWVAALVTAQAGRPEEARRLIDGLMPVEDFEAVLAVDLYYLLDPVEGALDRIISVADGRSSPNEYIEVKATLAFLRLPDELVTPERAARAGPAQFIERFPHSTVLWVQPFEDAEAGVELIRREVRRRAEIGDEVQSRILVAGDAPVGALAHAFGLSLAEVWAQLPALPLAYEDSSPGESVAAALRAAGDPVILDTGSLRTLELLPPAIVDAVLAELPLSMVTPLVLVDLIRATTPSPSATQDVVLRLVWNEDLGDMTIVEMPPEVAALPQRVAERMQQIAGRLQPSPPLDPQRLAGQEIGGVTGRIYAEIAELAGLTGCPVYTDDRFLRSALEGSGVATIGTLGVLGALRQRGVISEEEWVAAVETLREANALGIQ